MTRISVVQSEFERCEIIQNYILLSNQLFLSKEKIAFAKFGETFNISYCKLCIFIYGIKCVGELIAYTVDT